MSEISTAEMGNILEFSNENNLKYLNNILSIKDISDFDVEFIMTRLNLNSSVVMLIKSALEQYSKRDDISSLTSYNDYLYRIVRNIEIFENSSCKLSEELNNNKLSIIGFKTVLESIVNKSANFPEIITKSHFFGQFIFSKIYLDK